MSTLRISKRAHRDLSEIEEYVLKDDPYVADLAIPGASGYASKRRAATSFVTFQCEAESVFRE